MENKFAVFILTHSRADNVKTVKTLKKCGYTGAIYFIVDDEDKEVEKYKRTFQNVIVFNKKEEADKADEGNNFDDRRCILHARNACFSVAKELEIEYFLQLDDDYTNFEYRYISEEKLKCIQIKNLDFVFAQYLTFFKNTNFHSIAFAQGGDFVGGVNNRYAKNKPLIRKCMNSFFCSTLKPFKFVGSMNEDVNTYVTLGSRGILLGTIPHISLTQTPTQAQKKGMTDSYSAFGTYTKSFTTVLMHPSGVKVSMLNSNHTRIHHSIKWINAVPCILNEKYKK